ncbi:PREDICTED: U4/U6 small nuclear ribonucleoprotein Prp31 [Myotis davidii]|uniref:U4/U6 small nuclear ribonucleoprotein Prp31 n=1 Tax=Myotis davidii TaxID=225400 RepID=UPI000767B275|nr:PREDICTED: U4/U6 small nuclear ribonucleoprotein Prp31 [Myotis davidii]
MSLADELLADLEEAAEEEEGGSYGEEEEEPAIEDVQEETQLDLSGDSVKSIAKLWDSKMFAEIMMKIEEYISKQANASEEGKLCYCELIPAGPAAREQEVGPLFWVFLRPAKLRGLVPKARRGSGCGGQPAVRLSPHQMPPAPPTSDIIHKFIRDKYSKRFPELESLVPNALDYIRTVKELGNSLDKCKNNENLQQILTNATIMVVSVTASTTQGQQLSEEELERLEEACDMALELNASKHRIYEYVESRMSFIAPNLSIIIGASTAAKIMGVAGGLTNLSKMPACNIMLLGAQRKTLSGFSSTSVLPHTGYIYHSDIVQSLPPDLRRKAARLVAAKCTLAARVDSFHESTEGKVRGRRLSSWAVGCPGRAMVLMGGVRVPLPSSPLLLAMTRRRGSAQHRPEPTGLSGSGKQGRRLSLPQIEEDAYQEDLGFSLGHLGKSGSGRVRQTQVNEATRVRACVCVCRRGVGGLMSRGQAISPSCPSPSPTQGLEIVNPQAAEKKVAEANQKYFSSMAEFLKVKGEKNGIMST